MTDQMSNRNIEDVLSSIRRLVSQDTLGGATEPVAGAAVPAASRPPVATEKLVLTPDQRVNDPDPASLRADTAPADDADADTTGAVHADVTPAQRLAAGITTRPNGDTLSARPNSSLESTIAALEAAISSSAEHWDTDNAVDLPPHAGDNVTALHQHVGAGAGSHRKPKPFQVPSRADDVAKADDSAAPASAVASARLDPLHLTIAQRATPALSPVGAAQTDAGSVGPTDAKGPAPAQPEPAQSVAAENDATTTQPLPDAARPADQSDDALIDEDTLYEMVSEIVRAELQGQLGERITRSIRKLVRTEVARALAEKQYL